MAKVTLTIFLCVFVCIKSLQSCLTLCDPMDCSLPGSSTHGIFQQEYWSGVPLPSPIQSPSDGQMGFFPVDSSWTYLVSHIEFFLSIHS